MTIFYGIPSLIIYSSSKLGEIATRAAKKNTETVSKKKCDKRRVKSGAQGAFFQILQIESGQIRRAMAL